MGGRGTVPGDSLCRRRPLGQGQGRPENKNDVMRLGERPRSLEGKPDHLDLPFAINLYYSMSTISYGKALTIRLSKRLGAAMTARSFRFNIRVSVLS